MFNENLKCKTFAIITGMAKSEEKSKENPALTSATKIEDQIVVSENGEYMCATCPRTFKSIFVSS